MIKNLFESLSGLILILTMFLALCLSAAIYGTSEKTTIESYFFQPNEYYADRTSTPETPASLGNDIMRNMLIERFINEYFYVIPDVENIKQRQAAGSLMRRLSGNLVFEDWETNIVPILQGMAEEKKLRTVTMTGVTKAPNQTNYWIVDYILSTWEKPNDFSEQPVITHGQLYLKIIYQEGLRSKLNLGGKTVEYILEKGDDPAGVFIMKVTAVNSYEEIEQGKNRQ